jgi:hypothetical protein
MTMKTRMTAVVQQLVDEGRLVLGVGDLKIGQRLPGLLDERLGNELGAFDRLDDVLADALLHCQRDRVLAVDTGDGLGILEGRADRGEVANPHHRVGSRNHGKVGDILRRLDEGWHLDGVLALGAFDRAGGDEAVRRPDALDQLVELEVVGAQLHRIDDGLYQFVA